MNQQVAISGLGGQGVLFITRLLAEAALVMGRDILSSETHGMAMRGGAVISRSWDGSAAVSWLMRDSRASRRLLSPLSAMFLSASVDPETLASVMSMVAPKRASTAEGGECPAPLQRA